MRLPGLPALALLLVPSFSSLPAQSQAVRFEAAAISPDGKQLAWASGTPASLSVAPFADTSALRPVSPGAGCASSDPVWSPDSSTLAFLSPCNAPADHPGQQQIFLYTAGSGQTHQLTHVTGDLQHLRWSPDGKQIGFLFVQNATRHAGALDAMKPPSGVIGEDGIEPQRLALADAATGLVLQVTPTTLHTFEFDWAPDSRSLALIAAPNPGENNWWVAKLYLAELHLSGTSSAHARQEQVNVQLHPILDPTTISGPLHGLQIAVPRFSPDGQHIAFIGGLMSDQGSTGGDLWTLPTAGGQPTDLTPGIDGTPTFERWLDPSHLSFVEDHRGHVLLAEVDTAHPSATPLAPIDLGEVSVSGGPIKNAVSASRNGTLALIESSFSAPPELWAGPAASLHQITHVNDALRGTGLKTESLEWTDEGFHIQGWLTYPANYNPSQHYPLIVSVHGGPSASIGARWGAQSTYADAGYFVLQPNPRGSFGQGEKFTEANRKDFGYGDLRDILAGVDTVEKNVPVDPHREGLTGWSYGGFMTMFAVTQTHRFRAAVAGAGISDWQSYYGENSIDQWMTPFFGDTVYNDPAVYAKSSAINFIKNVTTPTLVIVGDRDGECPAPQSFEFWHALRAEHITTELVVYPDEGHGFRNPEHIADRTRRELAWFAKYMPATTSPSPQTGN